MASPGIGLNEPTQSSITNLVEQKLRAERVVKAGASWFLMSECSHSLILYLP